MVFHNTSQGEGSIPQFFLSIADKLKWEVEKYTDKSTSETFTGLGGFGCSYLASTECFSRAWPSAFRKSFASHVTRVVGLFIKPPSTRLCDMPNANDNRHLVSSVGRVQVC